MAPSDTKRCDPSLQIDVDLMILEFLLYSATRALLDHNEADHKGHLRSVEIPSSLTNELHMVDGTLLFFHALSPFPAQ